MLWHGFELQSPGHWWTCGDKKNLNVAVSRRPDRNWNLHMPEKDKLLGTKRVSESVTLSLSLSPPILKHVTHWKGTNVSTSWGNNWYRKTHHRIVMNPKVKLWILNYSCLSFCPQSSCRFSDKKKKKKKGGRGVNVVRKTDMKQNHPNRTIHGHQWSTQWIKNLYPINTIHYGGARGVMVIAAGIGHGDTSSNPGLIAFHIALIPLG